uniref:Uncharacterized protein n=1 Tax=Arion vulgaris TaxID=1028688 RepID=A0A0B6ZAI0_9EUPU
MYLFAHNSIVLHTYILQPHSILAAVATFEANANCCHLIFDDQHDLIIYMVVYFNLSFRHSFPISYLDPSIHI